MMFNPEFSLSQSIAFLANLQSTPAYATIGKVYQWNQSDTVAVSGVSEVQRKADISDAIIAKKILPQHASLVVRRVNWVAGKAFAAWDDKDPDILDKDFYCVTDDANVYKCVDNANGAQSTIKPTGTAPEKFTTADSYVWKYLFSITVDQASMFLTPTWMPVKEVNSSIVGFETQYASQVAAVPGTVDRLEIIARGNSYSQATTVEIHGDGTGATATINVHALTGAIESVSITNQGSGYTYAYAVIVDPSPTPGTDGLIEVVVSPAIGHGKRPALELGARNVLVSFSIEGNEAGNIKGDTSFRKIAVFNGLYDNADALLSGPSYNLTTRIDVDGQVGSFVVGEQVNFPNGNARVTYIEPGIIWVSSRQGTISGTMVGATSEASANVVGVVSPTPVKFGDVLFRSYFDGREKAIGENTGFLCNFKF